MVKTMKINDGQTLLFIGDSITDCGRTQPLGQRDGLGNGYVNLVNALLGACQPQRHIRVLNTGISGNRIIDLQTRWQRDVLDLRPDWLSVMIGINDVWRHFDNGLDPVQISLEQFESIYRDLLARTRPGLSGLVLMTPFFIEPHKADPMRVMMDAYGQAVARLAADFDAVFVDVQAAFDQYLACRPVQLLCGDRVHPNTTGHCIIARAFLKAIGLSLCSAD